MKYNADLQACGYANRQEGIAEGKIKERYKNARSLLGVIGVEQISKSLEIPLDEVQGLYNEKFNVNLE